MERKKFNEQIYLVAHTEGKAKRTELFAVTESEMIFFLMFHKCD